MAERYQAGLTQNNAQTVCLHDYDHWGAIFGYLWESLPFSTNNIKSFGEIGPTESIGTKVALSCNVQYKIRNQTNEPVTITAYYCRQRGNLMYDGGNAGANIYQFLAAGFATSGFDADNVTPTTNSHMTLDRNTPFDSYTFLKNFKITKTKKIWLLPGAMKSCYQKRSIYISPADYYRTEGTTQAAVAWDALTRKWGMTKFNDFVLFKLSTNPAGYGSTQSDAYSRQIKYTSPTVIMHTSFRYVGRVLKSQTRSSTTIEVLGIQNETDGAVASRIMSLNQPASVAESEAS